jgi:glucosamine--fructose-6-phosphate aminotransferase (isomerizing)
VRHHRIRWSAGRGHAASRRARAAGVPGIRLGRHLPSGLGRLELVKAVGKLENLKRKAAGRVDGLTTGIGHTRWATHGRVSEENAHPLTAGEHDDVAIVLNGIIENHVELRRQLEAEGERFGSQTDAEVVAHLVRRAYRGSLVEAIRSAYEALEGHFAFIALHREQPGLLVGTRRRCPLVVGVGDGEAFLASSMSAFLGVTRRVLLVEDGEVVAITAQGARVVTVDGDECHREQTTVPWDDAAGDRHGHETHMLQEIHEQPAAVKATIARNLRPDLLAAGPMFVLGAVENRDLARFRRIVIVACGTAYHAGLVGRLAIEEWADVPCEVDIASEWRHRRPRAATTSTSRATSPRR